MRIETPHRELVLKAISRVQVERPTPPIAALTPPWESIAAMRVETSSLSADSPVFAIYPSRLIGIFEEATAYARVSFTAGPAGLRGRARTQPAHPARFCL